MRDHMGTARGRGCRGIFCHAWYNLLLPTQAMLTFVANIHAAYINVRNSHEGILQHFAPFHSFASLRIRRATWLL